MRFDKKIHPLFKNFFTMKAKGRRMRMVQRPRTSTTLRQRAIIASCLLILLVSGSLTIYFNLGTSYVAYAATGDFRSTTSGNWNSTATWLRYNGSSWVTPAAPPSSTDGAINIQNGHIVTVTSSVTVDQLVISTGGQVTINASQTLQLVNGT
jgi:hypothetical protein